MFFGVGDWTKVAATPWLQMPSFTFPEFAWEPILFIMPRREALLARFVGDVAENVQLACANSVLSDVLKGNFFNVFKLVGAMQNDLVVVDKSTVPVGTADEVRALVEKELAARGVSYKVDVVSNPEFLKEGDAISDFMKPDRVVLGTDSERAASLMRELYSPFARTRDKIIVMGVRSAEMTKYAANCMLATKISFINEIATICEKVGADVRDVRTGIGSDTRIGYQFIYPGVGYGGSCFPKDVKALIHTAEKAGVEPKLLNAVEDVNARQKKHMAGRIMEYFAPQGGVKGKTLALWGLAFKANTDDMRHQARLAEQLDGLHRSLHRAARQWLDTTEARRDRLERALQNAFSPSRLDVLGSRVEALSASLAAAMQAQASSFL